MHRWATRRLQAGHRTSMWVEKKMVWAISILCISLSCEPIPTTMGWYELEAECIAALHLVDRAWQPTQGFYTMACVTRLAI